ncbi:MAG: WecB/TagA/CpsF family glycosyltransferase [Oscillospiraceae bacterium]|nr:WecB/TagA/CpsF family glycosyltransferase [Oscillospiraceae bacterium]
MRINILGVGFDNLSFEEALDAALELTRRGGYCVTPNPEIVMAARRDSAFAETVNGANLVVADGIGVIYAAKLLGTPIKAKIPGIDLAEALMARLAREPGNRGVFLFGAKPGIAELAAEKLAEKYSALSIAGTQNGYGYDESAVMTAIAAAKPVLVLVCLGAVKQERFMRRFRAEFAGLPCLLMGLGGALDVLSGTLDRAPDAWRRRNSEWLYRLLKQPSRIKRMIKLPLFLLAALWGRIFKC